MTIEEAVKVLNENRHRGYDDWHHRGHGCVSPHCVPGMTLLLGFEAIAIAEKYQREAKPDTAPWGVCEYCGKAILHGDSHRGRCGGGLSHIHCSPRDSIATEAQP